MEHLKTAFEDAKLYENYVVQKTNAQGYILWAMLIFVGSLISYLLDIIGSRIGVDELEMGVGISFLWVIIVATGMLFGFYPSHAEYTAVLDRKVSNKLWKYWFVAYFFSMGLEGFIHPNPWIETYAIFGVTLALLLGNIADFLVLKDLESLFIAIIMAIAIGVIILVPAPYEMIIFGLGTGLPYYLVGFKKYRIIVPQILLKTTE